MLSNRRIIQTWWPLAASWLLMGAELPALSAIVARLAEPEINLAAYGGVVFPLALIIEAPIIMLLAASTALSKDWDSYQKIYRFMMVTSAALTGLHVLVAFTPLYYLVVEGMLGVPQEIVEPARIGLMIMLPWTWAIAYRRFNQGVLIRFGHSRAVGVGTLVRMSSNLLVLVGGYLLGNIAGIVVATAAVATGVTLEAAYIGWVVRPVLHMELKPAPPVAQPLTLRSFLQFYIPLAMTSLLMLLANPIGAAAISRMPQALASLAVWPVLTGLVFMFRSAGMAYNEVVVALLDEPNSSPNLRRFATWLSTGTSLLLLALTVTPLANFWFERVSALEPHLVDMARSALWIALPLPALNTLQSWYQGAIMHGRRTRGITESVGVYLVTSAVILTGGVLWNRVEGLYMGLAALVLSMATQTAWLWLRSRPVLVEVSRRDAAGVAPQGSSPAD